MVKKIVKTKEELHNALKDKVDEIIVSDAALAKHVQALKKTQKVTKVAMWTLGGMAVAAFGASVLTGGTAAPAAVAFFAPSAAAATGLSTSAVIAIISLGGSLALALIGLLKGYDVEFEGGGVTVRLRRKKD